MINFKVLFIFSRFEKMCNVYRIITKNKEQVDSLDSRLRLSTLLTAGNSDELKKSWNLNLSLGKFILKVLLIHFY